MTFLPVNIKVEQVETSGETHLLQKAIDGVVSGDWFYGALFGRI
jgi:hypothetical protein